MAVANSTMNKSFNLSFEGYNNRPQCQIKHNFRLLSAMPFTLHLSPTPLQPPSLGDCRRSVAWEPMGGEQ